MAFIGSGAPLTSLNASNLASGTVPTDRLGTGTANSTTFLRGDGTWAAAGARKNVTNIQLTSTTPNATITAATNQVVYITTDATTPTAPSITLPNMTTLETGFAYFTFVNTTEYVVALKDSSGTTREFIAAGANLPLTIQANGTATGFWFCSNPPAAVSWRDSTPTNVTTGAPVGGVNFAIVASVIVPLTSTTFALLWYESGAQSNQTGTAYGQLYSFNTTTGLATASGTRVSLFTIGTHRAWPGGTFVFDTDQEGRALVGFSTFLPSVSGVPYTFRYFGIGSFGGQLYATSVVSANTEGGGACGFSVGNWMYCSYLGSNGAYAIAYTGSSDTSAGSIRVRGCTITGTTNLTLTDSASATTIPNSGTTTERYASRTGLTTFTAGSGNAVGRAIQYTPASNTFTVTTRTNQAKLPIENSYWEGASSFKQGGFYYGPTKVYFNGIVYDVTNQGAAGVTGTVSTGYNLKRGTNTNYNSFSGLVTVGGNTFINGTQFILVPSNGFNTADSTAANLNVNKYSSVGVVSNSGTFPLSTTSAMAAGGNGIGSNSHTYRVLYGDICTPLQA